MQRLREELAAEWRHVVVQQLKEGNVLADLEILAHGADTFVLTLCLPETDRDTVLVLDIS